MDVDVYIFVCMLSSLVLRRLVLLLSLFSERDFCAGNDRNSIIAHRPQIGEKKEQYNSKSNEEEMRANTHVAFFSHFCVCAEATTETVTGALMANIFYVVFLRV